MMSTTAADNLVTKETKSTVAILVAALEVLGYLYWTPRHLPPYLTLSKQ